MCAVGLWIFIYLPFQSVTLGFRGLSRRGCHRLPVVSTKSLSSRALRRFIQLNGLIQCLGTEKLLVCKLLRDKASVPASVRHSEKSRQNLSSFRQSFGGARQRARTMFAGTETTSSSQVKPREKSLLIRSLIVCCAPACRMRLARLTN